MALFRTGLCLFLWMYVGVLSHDVWILSPPSNIKTLNGVPIAKASDLLQLLESVLGLSTDKCSWEGVQVLSPFGAASHLAFVSVQTDLAGPLRPLFESFKGNRFPLKRDLHVEDIATELDQVLASKFGDEAQIKAQEQIPTVPEDNSIKLSALNSSAFPDSYFLSELNALLSIPDQLEDLSRVFTGPQVLVSTLYSVAHLESAYGKNSDAVKEAVALLQDGIMNLDRDLKSRGMALVTLSEDAKTMRSKRAAEAANEDDPLFTALFNLMLWFSVVFALAVLYVSIFVATMDPGKDSIIYRMTNPRMKKDN